MIPNFEDKLRDALIASINDVSETTLSMAMPVTKDKPDLKSGGQVICCVMLGGIVNCAFAMVASGESVCKLASKVLGNEITELNQDATHVVGEMAMKIAESVAEKLKDEGFGFDVQPVGTIDDTKFDEIKIKYMLAIRKCFSNEILGIDTSLMYQMPKEGGEADETPADETPEESTEEQPQEEKKSDGPQVILDVLEKEGAGAAVVLQPAQDAAVGDDLMSDSMKKLEEVINEIRKENKPRISITTETNAEATQTPEAEVGLQEIDTSLSLDPEEPPTLAPEESNEAETSEGAEPPTLADTIPPIEEAPSETASSEEGLPEAEEAPVESSPSEEPPKEDETPVEEPPAAEEQSQEEPPKELQEETPPEEPPKSDESESPPQAQEPPADASGGEEASVEEPPKEEPPKEEAPPEEEKPA